MYKSFYKTPSCNIILVSDGEVLLGLYFENSNDTNKFNYECELKNNLPIFDTTRKWLDIYFSGKDPDFTPVYEIRNMTPFRSRVLDIVKTIPYGKTMTYKQIADIIAQESGIAKMSAQAVGGAVGSNPICLIVPCHRVVGKDNKLVGYGGGIENKIMLLKHEKSI